MRFRRTIFASMMAIIATSATGSWFSTAHAQDARKFPSETYGEKVLPRGDSGQRQFPDSAFSKREQFPDSTFSGKKQFPDTRLSGEKSFPDTRLVPDEK